MLALESEQASAEDGGEVVETRAETLVTKSGKNWLTFELITNFFARIFVFNATLV